MARNEAEKGSQASGSGEIKWRRKDREQIKKVEVEKTECEITTGARKPQQAEVSNRNDSH